MSHLYILVGCINIGVKATEVEVSASGVVGYKRCGQIIAILRCATAYFQQRILWVLMFNFAPYFFPIWGIGSPKFRI